MTASALGAKGHLPGAVGGILALVLLVAEAALAPLEPDEWQHLTVTADIARGLPEYAGSWDNHAHALHHGLAWFLDPHQVVPGQVRAARLLTVAATVATALLLRGPARALGLSGWRIELASVTFLLSGPALAFGFQVRPDAYAGLLLTGSLALLCRPPHPGTTLGSRRALAAGLVAGLACSFSVKALIGIAGQGLAIAICAWRDPASRAWLRAPGFASGVAAGVLVWIACGVSAGERQAFIDTVFLGNAHALDRFRASLPLEHGVLLLAAALGLFVRPSTVQGRQVKPLISMATAIPALLYLFAMPAPYPQTLLLVAPGCALLATLAIDEILRPTPASRLRRVAAGLLLLAIVAPGVRKATVRASRFAELQARFREIAVVEALVPASGNILSGYGFVYSRPHALPYGALVKEVQLRLISAPQRLHDLVAALDDSPPLLVWWDERLAKLGPLLEEFVSRRYHPIEPNSVILRRRGGPAIETNGSTIP